MLHLIRSISPGRSQPGSTTVRGGYLTLVAIMSTLLSQSAYAQCTGAWSCISRNVTTPAPDAFLSAHNTVCKDGTGAETSDKTMDDDTIVTGMIRMDAAKTLTGFCDRYIWGTPYDTQTRYINEVRVNTTRPPNFGTWDNPVDPPVARTGGSIGIVPNTWTQSIDSRISSTTSPDPTTELIQYTGQYIFDFTLKGMSTDCLIPQSSTPTVRTLIGTTCLPIWKKDGAGGTSGNPLLPKFPLVDGSYTISVKTSSALESIVQDAVNGWHSALARAGFNNIQFVVSTGGCAVSEPGCIDVGQGTISACNPAGCGCSSGGNVVNHEYQERSRISVNTNVSNSDFKLWVISHELGHLLGLLEASHCTLPDSVMKSILPCDSTIPTGGGKATFNDGFAVAKTVYGGGPTKTCGWSQ